jgi:hypothetical protein
MEWLQMMEAGNGYGQALSRDFKHDRDREEEKAKKDPSQEVDDSATKSKLPLFTEHQTTLE